MNVQEVAAQYGEYLIEKRRYFHQHPEILTERHWIGHGDHRVLTQFLSDRVSGKIHQLFVIESAAISTHCPCRRKPDCRIPVRIRGLCTPAATICMHP